VVAAEVEDHRFRMDKNGEHDESLTITPGWQGARSAKLRSGSLRAAHEKSVMRRFDLTFDNNII